MEYRLMTDYTSCTIVIRVRSLKNCSLVLQAFDRDRPHTYFTNRVGDFGYGETSLIEIPMPLSPAVVVIRIYDEQTGNLPAKDERSFQVLSIKKAGLRQYLYAIRMTDRLRTYIDFTQRFCFNAGILPTNLEGEAYHSTDPEKTFKLRYMPVLLDPETGKEAVTPMRVDIYTRDYEASKKAILDIPVPGRIAISMHEASHFNLNSNPDNELEADLNGIAICLALGYSSYDIIDTYTETFLRAPTDQNAFDRMPHIEAFVDNFYKEFIYKNKTVA